MKMVIVAMVATFLLAGCTPEVKESKQESKQAIQQTENIQKSVTVVTDEEKAYLKVVGKSLEGFSDSATNISNLMKQGMQDPSLGTDKTWLSQLQGSFVPIALQSALLKKINSDGNVPERFETLHSNLEQSYDLMVEAGHGLVESFGNRDKELFDASMQTMAQSSQKMNEVATEMRELSEN